MTLVKIATGLWARPDQVLAIRITRGETRGSLTLRPAVTLHIPGCGEIGWEFDTLDDAQAWAAEVADKVNAVRDVEPSASRI